MLIAHSIMRIALIKQSLTCPARTCYLMAHEVFLDAELYARHFVTVIIISSGEHNSA